MMELFFNYLYYQDYIYFISSKIIFIIKSFIFKIYKYDRQKIFFSTITAYMYNWQVVKNVLVLEQLLVILLAGFLMLKVFSHCIGKATSCCKSGVFDYCIGEAFTYYTSKAEAPSHYNSKAFSYYIGEVAGYYISEAKTSMTELLVIILVED